MKGIKQFFQKLLKKSFVKKIIFCLIFTLIHFSLFAEIKIISPAVSQSSIFANKQVLVINATESEEVFYSFSNDEPLESGFVYDGPVLLDVTGEVNLNISVINKEKEKIDYKINFIVEENQQKKLTSLDETEFIEKLLSSDITQIISGQDFSIPETLFYSISATDQKGKFESGRTINVLESSNLERFLSLTIKSSENIFWNFVLHSVPNNSGEFTKSVVPFEFIDWTKLKFTDPKFIYSVDGGWWQGINKIVELDRTVSHEVKWQNVEYENSNIVHSFKIPAIPKINSSLNEDYSVTISLDGDEDFRFSKAHSTLSTTLSDGLYKEIIVDVFQGENFNAILPVEIYYQNIYQGLLFPSVQVNRARPDEPQIILTSKNEKFDSSQGNLFITRNNVQAKLILQKDFSAALLNEKSDESNLLKENSSLNSFSNEEKIFYTVVGPFKLSHEQVISNEVPLVNISSEAFSEYDNKEILLNGIYEQPVLYKIICYTVDKWNNVSNTITQNVNINMCDYFINENSSAENPDGTFLRPYKDLTFYEKIVNENSFSRFYISGKIDFPRGKISLKRNSSLIGENNSELNFSDESKIYLSTATLEIENLLINNVNLESDKNSNFFNLENSVLTIKNSALSFGRFQNASLFNLKKSIINIENSSFSTFANDYACTFILQDSSANIKQSTVATVATTNVNFSLKNSKLNLQNSTCSVSGFNSRIAELFYSSAILKNNILSAKNIQHKTKNVPIWLDENSILDEKNNKISGFKKNDFYGK